MKKTKVKRIMAVLMAATISCGMATNPVLAKTEFGNETISPYFIAIEKAYNDLAVVNGIIRLKGSTAVSSGYTASVTVELQKSTNNKDWAKAVQWSDTQKDMASISKTYTAISGYYYRIKSTHKAYDSNGKLLESQVKYSNVVK